TQSHRYFAHVPILGEGWPGRGLSPRSFGTLCPGLWQDDQIPSLRRITDFIRSIGSIPAIQLAHAGRKASMQRPWHGNGPLDERDFARGEQPWEIVAPSALPLDEGWLVPRSLERDDMK